jgi:hypothetical protein
VKLRPDQVQAKCTGILVLLSGDVVRAALRAWAELLEQKRRATRRWAHATEAHALDNWRAACEAARAQRALLGRVQRTWANKTLRWGLLTLAEMADERLYNRDVVRDAVSMWRHVRVIHAFRSLDEHACGAIHYRRVVAKFRRRTHLAPAQLALRAWAQHCAALAELARKGRLVVRTYQRKWVSLAFERLRAEVDARQEAQAEAVLEQSALLRRLRDRPKVLCFPHWAAETARLRGLRAVQASVAARVAWRLAHDAVGRWARVFVDLSFQERLEALEGAAAAVLRAGHLTPEYLAPMTDVLFAHAAWRCPRAHSRVAEALADLATIQTRETPAQRAQRHERRARLRRVAAVRAGLLRGARVPTPEAREFSLEQVLALQRALSQLRLSGRVFARAVEALSLVLRRHAHRVPHGRADPCASDDGDSGSGAEGGGAPGAGEDSGGASDAEDASEGLPEYARTPEGSPRGQRDALANVTWQEAGRLSVADPRIAQQQQLVPPYLGGHFAVQGLDRLRRQACPAPRPVPPRALAPGGAGG